VENPSRAYGAAARLRYHVEEWRSIDLADLRRWRMLDPTTIDAHRS
jgi:hypothetical protein